MSTTTKTEQEERRAKLHERLAAQHDDWVREEIRKKQLERIAARKTPKSPK